MKFFFLTKSICNLSAEKPDILDSIQNELIEIRGHEIAGDILSADALILQEAYSFKTWRYISDLRNDPVVGKYAHKVYVINTDDAATGLLRGLYTSLPKKRFDSLIHRSVPYAYFPNKVLLKRRDELRPEKQKLASWRGNLKSSKKLRNKLYQLYVDKPEYVIERTQSWLDHNQDEQNHYFDLLVSAKFSLCPSGWAPSSFRIYESMALGICPVIIADEFLPPSGPDWNSFSLKLAEGELNNLSPFLKAAEKDYEILGEKAQRVWDEHFHPDRVMNYYTDQLLECINLSLGKRSLNEEFERWQSWKMYHSNNWTFPQRVSNKMNKLMQRWKNTLSS